jgi:FK506-binding protein 2
MRTTSILTGLGLFFAGASALDKPLNIEVTKAVECSRKTVTGTSFPLRSYTTS